ncbi:putative methyltransferase-domain-containing protein [Elsinoe ampelina]|uniref:Putative methyltransferase-domain-containing protein n=1 Tax=Elsinoe ampelina TaxID=302913 RepID=A0A6A6GEP6_9PEZI|nr:putative methyltransferase-domain-containing protein [Elsinoe ampelina]
MTFRTSRHGKEGAAAMQEALPAIFAKFAESVQDPSEETFWLFSQNRHQHDLGMIDPTAAEITVTVAEKDFTIKQSPGLLTSSRSGGTTGAAVWRTTHLLAEWFASSDNALFQSGLLDETSTLLELGSGVAGLLPLAIGQRIGRYFATDQAYALKLLQENIDVNRSTRRSKKAVDISSNIHLTSLDWENDDLSYFLTSHGLSRGVDMIIASDCVYNYHLVQPLVETCASVARARKSLERPTLCLVAQQLREPDVFDDWLTSFAQHFQTYRLTDQTLGPQLNIPAGYVVHVGILKDSPS